MNMLSLFPAIPLLMMLGLWLSKSTRQIRAVMVAGSSLLLLLAAVLVVRYLGLREAGDLALELLRLRAGGYPAASQRVGHLVELRLRDVGR